MNRSQVFLGCLALVVGLGFISPAAGGVFPNALGGLSAEDPFTLSEGDSLGSLFVNDSSHVTINGGSIINDVNRPGSNRIALRLHDEASAVVNGGLLRNIGPGGSRVVQLQDEARLVINGGRFESISSFEDVIYTRSDGPLTINGGEFYGTNTDTVHTFFDADLNVHGGNFRVEGPNSALRLRSDGRTRVTGGRFEAVTNLIGQTGRGVTILSGELDFYDGQIDSDGEGLFTNGFPVFNLYGGSIAGDNIGLRFVNGTANLYGGTITGGTDIVQNDGVINLHVVEAAIGGQPLPEGLVAPTAGTIDVRYLNGVRDSLSFTRFGGRMVVISVPEPSSAWLVLLAFVGGRCRGGRSDATA